VPAWSGVLEQIRFETSHHAYDTKDRTIMIPQIELPLWLTAHAELLLSLIVFLLIGVLTVPLWEGLVRR